MLETPNPDPKPHRAAPIALWRVAETFLHLLYNLFGDPEAVAARHTLVGPAHTLLATWLRAGEALLRKLILIEAGALPRPNTRPRLWPRRKRVRRPIGFSAEAPEQWRVSFRCLASPLRARRPRRKPPAPRPRLSREDRWMRAFKRPRFYSAWPLAERYEALLRVFNNPEPYARRLAGRLYATPHRVGEVLRHAPALAGLVGPVGFAAVESAALETRARRFNSS